MTQLRRYRWYEEKKGSKCFWKKRLFQKMEAAIEVDDHTKVVIAKRGNGNRLILNLQAFEGLTTNGETTTAFGYLEIEKSTCQTKQMWSPKEQWEWTNEG